MNSKPQNFTQRVPTTLRHALIGVGVVLPIIGLLFAIKALQFGAMMDAAAQMTMPVERVNAVEVSEQEWRPRVPSVGTVVAVQGTIVSTESEGTVREIKFNPGSLVNAGDELVILDTDIEQAQLRAAEAAAEGARLTLSRAKELIASKSISLADLTVASVASKQADAQADNIRAVIAKKTIRAPFAGKLGIRQISVGQFLVKGSPVVSLQSLDPVYVEFSLPQQRLGVLTEGLDVIVSSDAYPQQEFVGKITAINPDIDPATRNVRVQATLANSEGLLRPGMFVSIDMILEQSEQVLFIPATAILHAPFGDSVYLIKEGEGESNGTTALTIEQQFVRLGARQGDYVVVTEGLTSGDRIVSTGVFKLWPGMSVTIDNSLAPDFTFAPTPNNT